MRKHITLNRLYLLCSVLILVLAFGIAQYRTQAAPSHPREAYSVAAISQGGKVDKRVLIADGSITMAAASTAVNGTVNCIQGDAKQFAAQLTLSGTMGGTAPTLDVVLQHSIDYDPAAPNSAHWITVTDFTDINATVTPASQYTNWSDVPASTAITFGDCYRGRYTFTGSGTVTANIGLHMIAK